MITIAGLGSSAYIPTGVAALVQAAPLVYARTAQHPALSTLPVESFTAFDDLLALPDAAQRNADVLESSEGDVLYLVPGHPRIADATVAAIVARVPQRCRIVPGEHPIDAFAAELGFHGAAANAQWCDALAFVPLPDARVSWATFHSDHPYVARVTPTPVRPHAEAWICNIDTPHSAQAVLLHLRAVYQSETRCALLRGQGSVEWSTIGAVHPPTHYPVTLYIAAAEPLDNLRSTDGIGYVIERLLGPGGCPWDHEQTPQSLRRTLLEETYEAIDALDRADDVSLVEELGDVLLNILMQAEMARQSGRFSIEDVYAAVTTKFVRRHPHVFGNVAANDSEAVLQNWYAIKATESAGTATPKSPLAGVPLALPALTATSALINKSKRYGMVITGTAEATAHEKLGAQLFALAVHAAQHNLDAEAALREVNARYRRRVDALYARDGHLHGQSEELWRDADSDT
jgi:tetrapyrrole methylase family protein/MazG family protein